MTDTEQEQHPDGETPEESHPHASAAEQGLDESVEQAVAAGSEETEGDTRFERRWSKRSKAEPKPAGAEPVGASPSEPTSDKARADELFDRLQRSMADHSNYRKRMEAEREEMAKLASMMLVAELLPVLDNFERALDSIPRELEMFSWLHGIALIERHLRAILEREGVEAIVALGSDFNPHLHEAIVEEESSDAKPGTVIGELQRGYTMHGRVLRPTLAKVAKAPGTGGDSGSEEVIEAEAVSPEEQRL